ncbi:MAG: transglutaminase-like domain-containing protein [Blastochloris sp.]|jgi:regulator of sirC expression with transglutaminase-like and TPR domain|nr:transglutaminase-like domain-containing protein [Blastochloris sp.]
MVEVAQQRALESLLADDDIAMRRLVVEELFQQREKNAELVELLAHSTIPQVSNQAKGILKKWKGETTTVPQISQTSQGHVVAWQDLEHLCWLFAKTEYPFYNTVLGSQQLDDLAERVLTHYQSHPQNTAGKLLALHKVLVQEEKFSGNKENYYSPSNSYLNQVLEYKTGIPLTLALIYIFIGMRLNWNIVGVNTPGHYLASIDGLIFDPFFGAMTLKPEALAVRFGGTIEECGCAHFFSATPFETAERMLSNLMNSYSRLGDEAKLKRVKSYLLILKENML